MDLIALKLYPLRGCLTGITFKLIGKGPYSHQSPLIHAYPFPMQSTLIPQSRSEAATVNLAYLLPICLVATLGGLLFGYDTGGISGAIEPMTAKFGLNHIMKGWASGCVLIGCAAGMLLAGTISDQFGRKKTLFAAAALFLISAIGTALPDDISTFIVFRILGGVGIGLASVATPMYIAEITPARY